jgi:4'-phosphopantetheinyl transferase
VLRCWQIQFGAPSYWRQMKMAHVCGHVCGHARCQFLLEVAEFRHESGHQSKRLVRLGPQPLGRHARSCIPFGPDMKVSRDVDLVLLGNEVHVWHANIDVSNNHDSLMALLDAEERSRVSRFKQTFPRKQFLIARAFLRMVLASYLGIEANEVELRRTQHGKPELREESGLQFNLSYSGSVVVLAVANRQVGIDVEQIREDIEVLELADRFFSRDEAQWLRLRPADELLSSFFSCWTAKEAYIKARGEGMAIFLNSFSVKPRADGPTVELDVHADSRESKRWSMQRLDLGPRVSGTLAVEGQNCKVSLRKFANLPAGQRFCGPMD